MANIIIKRLKQSVKNGKIVWSRYKNQENGEKSTLLIKITIFIQYR